MKVTIVPIVIGALGTVTKGLLKGLEDLKVGGRVETIQMTALLRTARILRRVLETWGDLLSLKLHWKRSANTDVKNSRGVNNNNNNNRIALSVTVTVVKTESVTRVHILDEAVCVSLHANVLGKAMNLSLFSVIGKLKVTQDDLKGIWELWVTWSYASRKLVNRFWLSLVRKRIVTRANISLSRLHCLPEVACMWIESVDKKYMKLYFT